MSSCQISVENSVNHDRTLATFEYELIDQSSKFSLESKESPIGLATFQYISLRLLYHHNHLYQIEETVCIFDEIIHTYIHVGTSIGVCKS